MGQNGCPLRAFAKTDNSQLDSEVTWDGIIQEFFRFFERLGCLACDKPLILLLRIQGILAEYLEHIHTVWYLVSGHL